MSPLEQPVDVYRPFTQAESEVLRGFVRGVRRLGHIRFFKQVPHSASMKFDEEGLRSEMQKPDDEDLSAAITQFRQLYSLWGAQTRSPSLTQLSHRGAPGERAETMPP